MPSSSRKQHQYMEAIAHGWHPSEKKGPSPAVAKDFVAADKETGAFASQIQKRTAKIKSRRGRQ